MKLEILDKGKFLSEGRKLASEISNKFTEHFPNENYVIYFDGLDYSEIFSEKYYKLTYHFKVTSIKDKSFSDWIILESDKVKTFLESFEGNKPLYEVEKEVIFFKKHSLKNFCEPCKILQIFQKPLIYSSHNDRIGVQFSYEIQLMNGEKMIVNQGSLLSVKGFTEINDIANRLFGCIV